MAIVNELITLLRYQLDDAGLKQATSAEESWLDRARRRVRQWAADFKAGFTGGVREAVEEHKKFNRETEVAKNNAQQLGNTWGRIRGWIETAMAALSVRRILSDIDTWGQLEARIKQATSSAQEMAQADAELARISRLTYKSYSDNAELFIRTRRTMEDLGKSLQDTIDLTEVLSLGMALSSTKSSDQESAISSLTKTVTLGTLGWQEYQTLMRTMPRLQLALADGMGITTVKLTEMAKAGQLTADKVMPALQSQLARMRVEAEDMPVTIADAMTVMNDALQRFFGKTLTQGRWVVLQITRSIEWLADNVARLAGPTAILAAAYGLTRLRAAMVGFRLVSLLALAPLLRMVAILTGIYLIGEDIFTWFRGGPSMFGEMVGPASEWQEQIQGVMNVLDSIRAWFGDAQLSITQFLLKWGAILSVVSAIGWAVGLLFRGLRFLLGPVVAIIRVFVLLMSLLAAIIGWPATLAIAIGALIVAAIMHWDKLEDHIKAGWEAIKRAAGAAWEWIKGVASRTVDGMVEYFVGAWRRAIDAVKEWFRDLMPSMSFSFSGGVEKPRPGETSIQALERQYLEQNAGQAPRIQNRGSTSNNQTNNIEQNITINAPTNNPAGLARTTSEAVARENRRSFGATGTWMPNVEASP